MTQDHKTSLTTGLHVSVPGERLPPDPVQRMLDEVTHTPLPLVAVRAAAQEIGPLLAFLVRLTGARRIVAAGASTKDALLSMAEALPPDGTLLTCDVSEERVERARMALQRTGRADHIELRTGPVTETLRAPSDTPVLDLAYIAADQAGTTAYWEALVPRTRQGGLLVVDHTLLGDGTEGAPRSQAARPTTVASGPDTQDADEPEDVTADDEIADDERVDAVVLTVADGLTLARKK